MRAYGSDRVRLADDGTIEISARLPKSGWVARAPQTLTRRERPGTAVLWDDDCFEVVDVVVLQQGVRYVLAPWNDAESMRVTLRYDEEAEAARAAERVDVIRRERQRRIVNVLAIFTGHLPGPVQQKLAHEVNVDAPRLTIASVVFEWFVIIAIAMVCVGRILAGQPLPMKLALFAGLLGLDGTIRFKLAFVDGRASGSVFGVLAYAIYAALTGKKEPKRAGESAPRLREFSAEEELTHSFYVREPLVTLLSPAEQQRIAAKFDYDYRRTATKTALGILAVAILGVVASVSSRAWVSLGVASILGIEQIVRIPQFDRRPVRSMLGVFARPLIRKFM
ncbi:MAG TPA: hypothetical protein VHU41_05925 [Thermoanaerobaculia bacterium]|jgi:hypothetical protein|nr:hypothetical protein [Thermoanaerobaculia bacterium]